MKKTLIILALLFGAVRLAAQCNQCTPNPTQLLLYPGVPTGTCSMALPLMAEDQATGAIYGCVLVGGVATWAPQGSGINVNGSPVASPNLNSTTPAADSGFVAATLKVSGSNAIAEVPMALTAPNSGVQYLSRNCSGQSNCTAVKWDAGTNCSTTTTCGPATTTSGSNIVTCTNCKFQTGVVGTVTPPAATGQVFFATDSTLAVSGANTCLNNPLIQFGGANQTTILSVDSDTQLHVNGNAGTSSTGKACIAWGDDDTTAINSAWAAGGCSITLMLPQGETIISAPIWQNVNSCGYVATGPYLGEAVYGTNLGSDYLIPTPNFTYTSIIGGVASAQEGCTTCTAAIGNPLIFDYANIGVFGLGVQAASTMANTALFMVGAGTRLHGINLVGWDAQGGGASLIGMDILGAEDVFNEGGSNFFGSVELAVNAVNVSLNGNFITGMNSNTVGQCGFLVGSTSDASSVTIVNEITKTCMTINPNTLSLGSTVLSQNSTFNGNTDFSGVSPDSSCLFIGKNSALDLLGNDKLCQGPQTNESSTDFFSTGAFIRMTNSQHFANGTSACITGAAANIMEDINDNSFTCGSGGIWNGLGNWMGSGSAHSVALVAANVVLSAGWGSTAAVTALTGGDFPAQFTITNSGTGQGASPTITYAFPYPLAQSPFTCNATQVGGNNATGTFTSSSLSKTGVTFTFSLTPTAADTEIVDVNCVMP